MLSSCCSWISNTWTRKLTLSYLCGFNLLCLFLWQLDCQFQHGSPGGTQRAICVLSASLDYSSSAHSAWRRKRPAPLLPTRGAAAESTGRRWVLVLLFFSSGSLFPPSHPSAVLWPDACPLQRVPKGMQGGIYKRLQDSLVYWSEHVRMSSGTSSYGFLATRCIRFTAEVPKQISALLVSQ